MKEYFDKEYFEGGTKSNYLNYSHEICYNDHEKLAIALKKIVSPSKVLDIGCAKGFLVEGFQKLGIDAYGVDISEYAISCSSSKVKEKLFVLDVEREKLPFPNEYFNLIVMSEVIEHLNSFDLVLNEMKRVLKKGGLIFLTTPRRKIFGKEKDVSHVSVHNYWFWVKTFGFYDFILDKKIIEIFLNERLGYLANKIAKFGWIGGFVLRKMTLLRTVISIRLFFRK